MNEICKKLIIAKSRTALSNRTFCSEGNVLYLSCMIWKSGDKGGCWALAVATETRNWFFFPSSLSLDSHLWSMMAIWGFIYALYFHACLKIFIIKIYKNDLAKDHILSLGNLGRVAHSLLVFSSVKWVFLTAALLTLYCKAWNFTCCLGLFEPHRAPKALLWVPLLLPYMPSSRGKGSPPCHSGQQPKGP